MLPHRQPGEIYPHGIGWAIASGASDTVVEFEHARATGACDPIAVLGNHRPAQPANNAIHCVSSNYTGFRPRVEVTRVHTYHTGRLLSRKAAFSDQPGRIAA